MEQITTPRMIGAAIAQARHASGLTQAQLAERAGVSRQLVNRLEMGTAGGIMFDKLLSVLSALGCSLFLGSNSEGEGHAQEPKPLPHVGHSPSPYADFTPAYKLDDSLFYAPEKDS